MIKLSDIPREDLEIGMKLVNYQGTNGVLVKVLPEDREDINLCIDWENGNESIVWHFQAEKIFLKEES